MRTTIVYLLISFFTLSGMFACRTVSCNNTGYALVLQGFDSADIAIVEIMVYKKGTGFTQQLNHIVEGSSITSGNGVDTLQVRQWSKTRYELDIRTDGDVIIRLPALAREFKVRDIQFIQEKYKEYFRMSEVDQCANSASLYVNDSLYTVVQGKGTGISPCVFFFNK